MKQSTTTKASPSKIKVLFVDDEKALRDWIHQHFANHEDLEFVTAADGQEAIELFKTHEFEVILLDHRLPGMDGIEVLKYIKEHKTPGEVIMLSAYGTISYAVEAMKIGAFDYIPKPFYASTLIEKIKSARQYANSQQQPDNNPTIDEMAREFQLTSQEQRVIELLFQGLRNQRIGEELHISEHTVKSHLRGIFRKMDVNSRAELLARFLQNS